MATPLQQKMDDLFWDKESGGYFTATTSDPSILIRMKEAEGWNIGSLDTLYDKIRHQTVYRQYWQQITTRLDISLQGERERERENEKGHMLG